jgi:hypothetical protein
MTLNKNIMKSPLMMVTLSAYAFLVSAFFFVQTLVVGFKLPSHFPADLVGFAVVVFLGILIPLIWLFARSIIPVVLTIWWLPQIVVITKSMYSASGVVTATPEWRVVMLFFFGPNVGFEIGPATYRLFHLNVLALAALVALCWVHLKSKRTQCVQPLKSHGTEETT